MKNLKTSLINLLIVSVILSSTSSFADDPTLLQLNQPAPYPGLLFSQEKALELHNRIIEGDALKNINESLEKSLSLKNDTINTLESQKTLLIKDGDNLATNLRNERDSNKWSNLGYFFLGVVGTCAAIYAVKATQ